MEQLNINTILNRGECVEKLKDFLVFFEANKHNLSTRRGVYVYGAPGTGKTYFVKDILRELNYDIIHYDAGDIRNKSIIDTITKHNMSDQNILSMFYGKTKKIAIVMDEIDGMNSGDKGGINSLIKLIRPKKTKKQKLEDVTLNPIICIGNYHIDKKIKELMKVCHTIELKNPKKVEIKTIITKLMPSLEDNLIENISVFVQGDLRKLKSIIDIYKSKMGFLKNEIIKNIFHEKSFNEDTKKITKKLINNSYELGDHNLIMNETDRTIVGLLWHENVIDVLGKVDKDEAIPIYCKMLDNICFSDYIDRITFQKQIWQFNEMSSLTKTFYNNNILHNSFDTPPKLTTNETRFTKVLTKYSTEYNNCIFIQNLCQNLNMDKKDVFSFFLHLRNKHDDEEVYNMLSDYEINKLDVNRIYRYLDKYTKQELSPDDDCSSINSF